VALEGDPRHCGGCGIACAPGEACTATGCVATGGDAGPAAPHDAGESPGDADAGDLAAEDASPSDSGSGSTDRDDAAPADAALGRGDAGIAAASAGCSCRTAAGPSSGGALAAVVVPLALAARRRGARSRT
jgi:MYXO-CTERM domain-containing protein